MALRAPMVAARAIIIGRRRVSSEAEAAGVTSIADINATPTVCNDSTMVMAMSSSIR